MERGILITPRYSYQNGITKAEHVLRPSDALFYLTYWDRVRVIQCEPIYEAWMPGTLDCLKGQGYVMKIQVHLNKPEANPLSRALSIAHDELEKKTPGYWSVGRTIGGTPKDLTHDIFESRRIEFDLYEALPFPDIDTPLHELFEYKHKRADELLALRSSIDELYLEIGRSSDLPRAKTAAIQRLSQSIADVQHSARESWGQHLLASAWKSFDMGNVFTAASSYALAGPETAVTISLAQGAITFFRNVLASRGQTHQHGYSYAVNLPESKKGDFPAMVEKVSRSSITEIHDADENGCIRSKSTFRFD